MSARYRAVTYERPYTAVIWCDRCGIDFAGSQEETKTRALTSTCDDAKAAGWTLTGNVRRAVCPECAE